MEAVSEECTEIIQVIFDAPKNVMQNLPLNLPCYHFLCLQSFQKIFGKKVLESDDAAVLSHTSEERPGSSESSSIVLQARGTLHKVV